MEFFEVDGVLLRGNDILVRATLEHPGWSDEKKVLKMRQVAAIRRAERAALDQGLTKPEDGSFGLRIVAVIR